MFSRILLTASLLAASLLPQLAEAQGAFANVPEAAGYQLVYQLNIAGTATAFNTTSIPYAVNNAASFAPGSFGRVAYYLELSGSANAADHNGFMYVSFDAAGFTNRADKIGVPNKVSGELYQQNINNMNIVTNLPGITTGTGLTGGNIEFWPSNYDAINSAGVPGASGTTFDWGDRPSGIDNYGSMQIHNHNAGQVLLAYNQWGGNISGPADLGIGNNTALNTVDSLVHPDWTFSFNAAHYSTRTLQILVQPSVAATPEPGTVALFSGLILSGGLLLRRRR